MPDRSSLIIGVDFDGTIVDHSPSFPDVGPTNPGAFEVLRSAQDRGCRLILFTMRSGGALDAAVMHCLRNGLLFYGINENPTQGEWTSSPKVYCHTYIDDAALGCPLRPGEGNRRVVDWFRVDALLTELIASTERDWEWAKK